MDSVQIAELRAKAIDPRCLDCYRLILLEFVRKIIHEPEPITKIEIFFDPQLYDAQRKRGRQEQQPFYAPFSKHRPKFKDNGR